MKTIKIAVFGILVLMGFLFQNFALMEGKTVIIATHDEDIKNQAGRRIKL